MPIPLVTPSAPVVAGTSGPTVLRLRNRLADELGWWQEAVVTGTPTHADAARTLLLDEARDDESGYGMSQPPDDLWRWAYVRSGTQAGTQRRILSAEDTGHQGPRGAVVTSRPFDAVLVVGSVVELTSPLPVVRHLGIKGLVDLLLEGLARCRTTVRIATSGNGTDSHDLSSYPILHEAQIKGISDTEWVASPRSGMRSPHRYRIEQDGATVTLVTDMIYGDGAPFVIEAIVPADRLLYDGAAWTLVRDPPAAAAIEDDWRVAVPEAWAVALSMAKALPYLQRLTAGRRDLDEAQKRMTLADLQERKRVWARAGWLLSVSEMPQPTQSRTVPPFVPASAREYV